VKANVVLSFIIVTTAVILYIVITVFITVYVGQVLFSNGRPFILRMLKEETLTNAVNRILLTGYYLVNLGYVSVTLTMTEPASSVYELIESLSISIGRIVLTLGIMHYFNIGALMLWNHLNTSKRTSI
jgi:hypothetical protein